MHPMTQLDQIRKQMVEELAQVPQYRALKAMERFLAEVSAIYDAPAEPGQEQGAEESRRKIAEAIENHLRGDAGPAIVKNVSYRPVHRVA